jgi:hypothetical protein
METGAWDARDRTLPKDTVASFNGTSAKGSCVSEYFAFGDDEAIHLSGTVLAAAAPARSSDVA